MSDASVLLRDIAGDAATKTAGRVKPSDEQLSQIDKPAEDNTWHEAPNFSKENIRSQIDSRNPIKKKDAEDAAKAATGTSDPNAAANTVQQGQHDPAAGAQTAKDKVSSRIRDEDKEKMRQYREKTQEYFKGKFPQERKDQTILRLKKMIVEVQTHQDCRFQMMHSLIRNRRTNCLSRPARD